MKIGIPLCGLVPVRKEPADRSEMVTQILFGETCLVLEVLVRWARVSVYPDQYRGWASLNMLKIEDQEGQYPDLSTIYRIHRLAEAKKKGSDGLLLLPPGSLLRDYDPGTLTFLHLGERYTLSEPAFLPDEPGRDAIVYTAASFLNCPYLWGGKSPLGFDCSGLVQLVFFMHNILLPRDAHYQAELGDPVSFLQESMAGDLAFFENEKGRISHVGILSGKGSIIHASGFVREDPVDQEGIFNPATGNYSHRLRLIKRVL